MGVILPQDIEKLKAAFGDREFTGKQATEVLGIDAKQFAGAVTNHLKGLRVAYKTANGWRFGTKPEAPISVPAMPSVAQPVAAPVVTSELVCSAPSLVHIGELYIPQSMTWIADTIDRRAITLHTAILEIDPATKHPRNKRITFHKDREPREYAQFIAWLDGMAGVPPQAVDETALELAAELEKKLNAANKEIAELKAKIDAIRGMFRGEL